MEPVLTSYNCFLEKLEGFKTREYLETLEIENRDDSTLSRDQERRASLHKGIAEGVREHVRFDSSDPPGCNILIRHYTDFHKFPEVQV